MKNTHVVVTYDDGRRWTDSWWINSGKRDPEAIAQALLESEQENFPGLVRSVEVIRKDRRFR